ncbi:MAG: porin family protein [Nitrospirota bacterium]
MKKVFVLMVLMLTLLAAPAMAKEGFFIGASLIPSVDISGDAGNGLNDGSGYGFRLGLGFSKYFSIEGVLERTKLDWTGGGKMDMDGVAVNARLNFPLTTLDSAKVMSFEPYVLAGYGRYEVTSGGQSNDGSGFRLGIGIEQYLFKELSVNVGYTSTSVTFNTNPEMDGTIRVIDIGLIYHFL